MRQADDVHRSVSEAYTRAVQAPARRGQSACGCCAPVEQKGVAVKSAGYDADELADLPADAVNNSFGCGNPLAFSDVRAGETVLDLGCGAGIDLLIAARKVGPTGQVIGVDMTDAMIERARANALQARCDNIDVRKGYIEQLPVESNSVDHVISNCVINLSPDKPRVWAEIARVLKPGGRVSISDIVVESLPEALRDNAAVYNSCLGGAISEREYLAGLEDAGLTEVAVTDRHTYTAAQLADIVHSELPEDDAGDTAATGGCCATSTGLSRETIESLVDLAVSRVWSARFSARRAS